MTRDFKYDIVDNYLDKVVRRCIFYIFVYNLFKYKYNINYFNLINIFLELILRQFHICVFTSTVI